MHGGASARSQGRGAKGEELQGCGRGGQFHNCVDRIFKERGGSELCFKYS